MTQRRKTDALPLEVRLQEWMEDPLTDKSMAKELKTKAGFTFKTGLFRHHVYFMREEDGCVYYMDYYGSGWHKRKINPEGWIKCENLALNVYNGDLALRKKIFKD